MANTILEMRDISKSFPGVKALEDVSISVEEGSVHAICGENGAGKSTLMKVLSGVYPHGTFEGEIVMNGEPVEFRDFITRLLATQGVDAGTRSVPRWVARTLVALTSWMKRPPLTRMAFALMAHEVTIDDSKARRELGYAGRKTVEEGLAELR